MDSRKYQLLITVFIPVFIVVFLLVLWSVSFYVGFVKFNRDNSVLIFSTIIIGMSALLSIVLAVSIFRIQSLENRMQSIEQSTLDYIYRITTWTYPYWCNDLEEHIKNKLITESYFQGRKNKLQPKNLLQFLSFLVGSKEDLAILEKDRDNQQERLFHNLTVHTKLKQTISTMKKQIQGVTILLILPIAISILLLMTTDSLPNFENLFLVSLMVYLSILGIGLLTVVVLQSMIQQADT